MISTLKQKMFGPAREELLLSILLELYRNPNRVLSEAEIHAKVAEHLAKSRLPLNYDFIRTRQVEPFSYELALDLNRLVSRGFVDIGPIEFIGNLIAHTYRITDSGKLYAEMTKLRYEGKKYR